MQQCPTHETTVAEPRCVCLTTELRNFGLPLALSAILVSLSRSRRLIDTFVHSKKRPSRTKGPGTAILFYPMGGLSHISNANQLPVEIHHRRELNTQERHQQARGLTTPDKCQNAVAAGIKTGKEENPNPWTIEKGALMHELFVEPSSGTPVGTKKKRKYLNQTFPE